MMPMYRRRALYPEDWEAIAAAVKEAAGWRCEQCGHPHEPAAGYTLTVHHIDGNPGNNAPENLVALCQRCHLGLHGRRYWIGQGMFEFFKPLQLERFPPLAEQLARGDGGALPGAAVHRAGRAVDDDGGGVGNANVNKSPLLHHL